MAPQYGEVRVDYITYTTGVSPNEANVTVPVSGLINDPTFSGNVIIEGDLTVSGSINASGVIISGITGLFDDGTEAAPSIAFASDPDTGIYKPATNEIGISTNASEALRIDNTGNVGIGTATPKALLHIKSNGIGLPAPGSPGAVQIGDSYGYGLMLGGAVSNGLAYIQAQRNDGGTATYTLALNPNGGKVGIGTDNPLALLTIKSPEGGELRLDPASNSGDGHLFRFGGSASDSNILRFVTSGDSERMRLASNGNVGIGTTDPARNLVVNNGSGNAFVSVTSSDTGFAGLLLGDQTADSQCQLTYSNNTDSLQIKTASTEQMRITADGNVGIGTTSPAYALDVQAADTANGYGARIRANATAGKGGIQFTSDTGPVTLYANIFGNSDQSLSFGTGGTGLERARIDSSGNVGIGISNFDNLGAVYSPSLGLKGTTGSRLGLWGNGGRWWYAQTETANRFILGTRVSSNTADKTIVSVNTDGNVGIGAASPNQKLEVQGNINIGTSGVAGPYGAFFLPTAVGDSYFYQYNDDNNNFTLGRGAVLGSNKLVSINAQGNVGIGKSSPETVLHLRAGNPMITLEDGAGSLQTSISGDGGELALGIAGSEAMRIDSSGNVGIGTDDPQAKLDVNGLINSSGGVKVSGGERNDIVEGMYYKNGLNVTTNSKLTLNVRADDESLYTNDLFNSLINTALQLNDDFSAKKIRGVDARININDPAYSAQEVVAVCGRLFAANSVYNNQGDVDTFKAFEAPSYAVSDSWGKGHGKITGTAYGFYSDISQNNSITGDAYNFYAAGAAPNYFAGVVRTAKDKAPAGTGGDGNPQTNDDNRFWATASTDSNALRLGSGFQTSYYNSNAAGVNNYINRIGNAAGRLISFYNAGVFVDSIRFDGSGGITYGTSDYRTKENIVDLPSAVDQIKALRPVNFNFNWAPGKVRPGFIAHELAETLPAAVTGEKDETEAIGTLADYNGTVLKTSVTEPPAEELTYTEEVEVTPYVAAVPATYDEDGNEVTAEVPELEPTYTTVTRTKTWTATGTRPVYQGVDQTKLIPLLTKALQESLEKIEALEARLNAAGIA